MSSTPAPREATRLGELTARQWKSGIAAWLGWLFDGLELHLYTLVAAPLVMQLLQATSSADPAVKEKSAYIQAAFSSAGPRAVRFSGGSATASAGATRWR